MDIQQKDVDRAVKIAVGHNSLSDAEMQLTGMILLAQMIEDHRATMDRVADAIDKLANNVGVVGCSISDISREVRKAVEIYKHSE